MTDAKRPVETLPRASLSKKSALGRLFHVNVVQYATGKDIDTILSERNLTIDEDAFEDTDNKYILAAYALEITKGTRAPSEGKPGVFDPNGSFNREMAATMLARVSKVLGEDTENALALAIRTSAAHQTGR